MNVISGTPICGETHIDKQHEDEVRAHLPSEDEAADAAAVFTHLSDTTRVKLLSMLAVSDMCVCEIADFIGHEPSPRFRTICAYCGSAT
jgi:hypothetical protein